MTPRRIQRQRTKGWRMPEGAVYVGRPSRWANPFRIGPTTRSIRTGEVVQVGYTAEEAVELFRRYAEDSRRGWEWLEPLRGNDLACWCPLTAPNPWQRVACHADVLLELANASDSAVTGTAQRSEP